MLVINLSLGYGQKYLLKNGRRWYPIDLSFYMPDIMLCYHKVHSHSDTCKHTIHRSTKSCWSTLKVVFKSRVSAGRAMYRKFLDLVTDLPSKAVDMVINALDTHGPNLLACQDWYNSVSSWVQSRRTPCLAFDPSVDGSAFPSHWALGLVLPLDLPSSCGKQYLCDVGLPSGIFQKVGIEYSPPFCHKFYIALNWS